MNDSAIRPQVLVVDDEPGIREVMQMMLELEGYSVTTVEDGLIAYERMSERLFDLVISDIRMPILTGVELLKKVKTLASAPPPIILVTGFSEYDEAQLKELGAFSVVRKPFTIEELLIPVRSALIRSSDTRKAV